MNKRVYLWTTLVVVCCFLAFSGCSRKTGCPTFGTKATKKEIKKGGSSNLFDKKTRRKVG